MSKMGGETPGRQHEIGYQVYESEEAERAKKLCFIPCIKNALKVNCHSWLFKV